LDEAGINGGKWSPEEHAIFLEGNQSHDPAIEKHGCEWKIIADKVGSRTPSQVRSHAQKFFNKRQNDQDKIGKNKTVIIGQENDGTSTRSRFKPKEIPAQPKETLSNPARKNHSDPGFATPKRTQPIKKERKERKAMTAQRNSERAVDNSMEQEDSPSLAFKFEIAIPAFTWCRSREERAEREEANSMVEYAETEVEPSYFINTMYFVC
jgi:SHAQKYF class myb-like DNA-binding protein